jgi:acetyl-CoA acetyltransferase
MTTETKAAEYKRNMLEGGEGYNPHAAELERRELATEAARTITPAERRCQILRELETADSTAARECGAYDATRVQALRDELAMLTPAEWTREETITIRAAWNARVKAGEFTGRDGKIDAVKVQAAMTAQGWTINDLKRAIQTHNL